MKAYQNIRQRCIVLPDCDGCSVNIILMESDDDFMVSVMSINGGVIGDLYEKTFTTKAVALDFYDKQAEQFSEHPYHPEVIWSNGVPVFPEGPTLN
jgi:hypothetical protein